MNRSVLEPTSSKRHPSSDDPIDVVAGVITRQDRVLACRRRPTDDHPGQWEFPGGKREAGETMVAALRRELREELGISAEIGLQIWQTQHRYAGRPPITLYFFHVPGFDGPVTNQVFAEIRWVPVGALTELDFLAADRDFVARLERREVRLPGEGT